MLWDNEFHGNLLGQQYRFYDDLEVLNTEMKALRINVYAENVRAFRIAEEVNIDHAYPDYYGGDDSGGCP